MEAGTTSETSVNFYQTILRNNPEYSHLHTCCRENSKYYKKKAALFIKSRISICASKGVKDICKGVQTSDAEENVRLETSRAKKKDDVRNK
jgi:hypothetical protein